MEQEAKREQHATMCGTGTEMTSSEGSGISQKGCTPEYWKTLGSKPDFKVSELWSHGRLPNCACKRKWTRASAAMLATKMSAGVAPDVILRNPWHKKWQSIHFAPLGRRQQKSKTGLSVAQKSNETVSLGDTAISLHTHSNCNFGEGGYSWLLKTHFQVLENFSFPGAGRGILYYSRIGYSWQNEPKILEVYLILEA